MHVDRALVPVAATLIVAVVGTVVLFRMDFGAKNDVQRGAINMITAAAVDRAGATAVQTEQPSRP